MTENHSDDEDTLLLHEPPVHSGAKSSSVPQISDQTFELFTSYFDSKISSLKNELVSGNDSLAKKLKKEVSVKLKGKGIRFNTPSTQILFPNCKNFRSVHPRKIPLAPI